MKDQRHRWSAGDCLNPLDWRRGPRSSFTLSSEHGLYALFLCSGSKLGRITPGEGGLLYLGLAANRRGLKGRCHFNGKTRNHSPRKSLAVLLQNELGLRPVLIPKPNAPDTWGLDQASEEKLSAWMHANLSLAIFPCPEPEPFETELIERLTPPLNLRKCQQNEQHSWISQARENVFATVKSTR